MALSWTCKPFSGLTAAELYQALQLRSEVFVIEQQCIYLDPDGLDPQAWHLSGRNDGRLQAYLRLLPPGLKSEEPVIGRVVTAPAARGGGLGRQLLVQALVECEKLWPGRALFLSAQAHLQSFYGGLGFVPVSEQYVEDGIAHVDMRRPGI
ncbi:GNAT family N-acetyltransferase [Roseateles toxinivorans]|uniref:ElaA protein n=1 Tax=Roseateles toxinivorans TaxID=270368 RepID=A0A4R6QS17_9BURK|nr:GNAT family N-acetyltransferase [Roseateles toxinivorans]TDP74111.1 ElaA protein [Roseateles toxinivorans]